MLEKMAMNWEIFLGVVGLIVSLGGFWLTLAQLNRTAKATAAVQEAIVVLRSRINVVDFGSECVRAQETLTHAIRLLTSKAWKEAAISLTAAQSALHKMSLADECSDDGKKNVQDSAQLILKKVSELETLDDGSVYVGSNDLIMDLRKLKNSIDTEVVIMTKGLYNA